MDPRAPVSVAIPGDPAALRNAANAMRTIADREGHGAAGDADAARTGAQWQGPAGDAFRGALGSARRRIDRHTQAVVDAANPVLAFADTLADLQDEYRRSQGPVIELLNETEVNPADPNILAQKQRAIDDLQGVITRYHQANISAAREVKKATSAIEAPHLEALLFMLTGTSVIAEGRRKVLTTALEIAEGKTPTTRYGSMFNRVLGVAGWALAPITAAGSQYLRDESNPNYSEPERIGRALTRGAIIGIPGTLAGTAAAPVGEAVLTPIGATAGGAAAGPPGAVVGGIVGGALGAFVAAGVGSYATSTYLSGQGWVDKWVDGGGHIAEDGASLVRPRPRNSR